MGDTEETLGPWLWPGTVPDVVAPIRGLNRQIKKKKQKTESISFCAFQIKANLLE